MIFHDLFAMNWEQIDDGHKFTQTLSCDLGFV